MTEKNKYKMSMKCKQKHKESNGPCSRIWFKQGYYTSNMLCLTKFKVTLEDVEMFLAVVWCYLRLFICSYHAHYYSLLVLSATNNCFQLMLIIRRM